MGEGDEIFNVQFLVPASAVRRGGLDRLPVNFTDIFRWQTLIDIFVIFQEMGCSYPSINSSIFQLLIDVYFKSPGRGVGPLEGLHWLRFSLEKINWIKYLMQCDAAQHGDDVFVFADVLHHGDLGQEIIRFVRPDFLWPQCTRQENRVKHPSVLDADQIAFTWNPTLASFTSKVSRQSKPLIIPRDVQTIK